LIDDGAARRDDTNWFYFYGIFIFPASSCISVSSSSNRGSTSDTVLEKYVD